MTGKHEPGNKVKHPPFIWVCIIVVVIVTLLVGYILSMESIPDNLGSPVNTTSWEFLIKWIK